jgi:transposase InsO family protein
MQVARVGEEPLRRRCPDRVRRGTNLHLARVIDCYSRRVAGWTVANHMRVELIDDALKAAAVTRGSPSGAIFHSDHGSVHTSKD